MWGQNPQPHGIFQGYSLFSTKIPRCVTKVLLVQDTLDLTTRSGTHEGLLVHPASVWSVCCARK